jgi:hypothetical protein
MDGRAHARDETDKELLAYLAKVAGREIRTREDIAAYVADIAQRARRKQEKRQRLKNALLGALLIVSLFQYYFIDVQLEILSQPTLTVFYPLKAKPGGTKI